MIRQETAHIEEIRGIRKLDLNFGRENFAISGPNGSGESGVVDAIEFGLHGRYKPACGTGDKGTIGYGTRSPRITKFQEYRVRRTARFSFRPSANQRRFPRESRLRTS
jgi:DNA repair exonuclease SbcCD ATPase subunit